MQQATAAQRPSLSSADQQIADTALGGAERLPLARREFLTTITCPNGKVFRSAARHESSIAATLLAMEVAPEGSKIDVRELEPGTDLPAAIRDKLVDEYACGLDVSPLAFPGGVE